MDQAKAEIRNRIDYIGARIERFESDETKLSAEWDELLANKNEAIRLRKEMEQALVILEQTV